MNWVTIGIAARQLGISTEWLRKAEKQGKIPTAKRRFGQRMYSQEDIDSIRQTLAPSSVR